MLEAPTTLLNLKILKTVDQGSPTRGCSLALVATPSHSVEGRGFGKQSTHVYINPNIDVSMIQVPPVLARRGQGGKSLDPSQASQSFRDEATYLG